MVSERHATPEARTIVDRKLARVFIWRKGSRQEFDSSQRWVAEMISHCETLLSSADDVAKEAVTKWTLKRVRSGEAIELLYAKPRQVTAAAGAKSIRMDGLLIPLEPIGGSTVIIYHRLRDYSAGPLLNTRGAPVIDQLRRSLADQGVLKK